MRIPSGCSKLKRSEIIERVKGLIFGKSNSSSTDCVLQQRNQLTPRVVTKKYKKLMLDLFFLIIYKI